MSANSDDNDDSSSSSYRCISIYSLSSSSSSSSSSSNSAVPRLFSLDDLPSDESVVSFHFGAPSSSSSDNDEDDSSMMALNDNDGDNNIDDESLSFEEEDDDDDSSSSSSSDSDEDDSINFVNVLGQGIFPFLIGSSSYSSSSSSTMLMESTSLSSDCSSYSSDSLPYSYYLLNEGDHNLQYLFAQAELQGNINNDAIVQLLQDNPSAAELKYYSTNGFHYPIYHAIGLDASLETIKAFVCAFPKAVRKSYLGKTLLHLACQCSSSSEILQALIEEWPGAAKQIDDDFMTPLHVACEKSACVHTVSVLLGKHPSVIYKRDARSRTPLHYACASKAPLEVISLLMGKTNVKILLKKDNEGCTPLHLACKHSSFSSSYTEVISHLLDACPSAAREQDDFFETPLHFACENQNTPFYLLGKLLVAYPDAVLAQNIGEDTPKSLFYDENIYKHADFDKIFMVMTHIERLLEDRMNRIIAKTIMTDFRRTNWAAGVRLLFDLYPPAVESLDDIPINVIPDLLSMMGRHCSLGIFWNMISNRQELLNIT